MILDALCFGIVLFGFLCYASLSFSLKDETGGHVLQCACHPSVLTVDEALREQRCVKRNSGGRDIPKPLVCNLNSPCGPERASSGWTMDFIRPAHSGIIFFLRHIPVRAGPCHNC
ncbi:MAG: hypothetical protein IJS15_03195 [Victivallales bacterium]|nr:hypothetical protein [Victivallales bacterium]